jgi:RNA polymerase sigma factor (sigma-70 family)
MPRQQLNLVLRQLRLAFIAKDAELVADAELIDRFIKRRDEAAFALLVRRHGALVLKVCRHVLHRPADADDAFQSTFLVLARKAGSVRRKSSLASWLHGVALRCSLDLRRSAMRRRKYEDKTTEGRPSESAASSAAVNELQAFLDEEVERLSQKCRDAFVVCCLEGKSRAEAAQLLNCTEGTLASRLAKARDLLQKRLTARGVSLSSALCAAALSPVPSSAMVPAALAHGAVDAAMAFAAGNAAGALSPQVVAIAEGVIRTMFAAQLKATALVLVAASLTVLAAGAVAFHPNGGNAQTTEAAAPVAQADKPVAGDEKTPIKRSNADSYGDPLPEGAIARFGTLRLRHPRWVTGVALSADGKTVASSGWDATVRLWDADTGKEGLTLKPSLAARLDDRAFLGVVTASNGKVVGLRNGSIVCVWDIKSGEVVGELKGRNGFGMALSPDGKTLAKGLGGEGFGQVELWDLEKRTLLRSLSATKRVVQALAFAPDGTHIAFGELAESGGKTKEKASQACSVHVFNLATGQVVRRLDGHEGGVTSLTFAPDGNVLVSASHDATLRFWDPKNGRLLRTVKVPDESSNDYFARLSGPSPSNNIGGVVSVTFSPDGRLLACGGYDGDIRLWNPATGAELRVLRGHDAKVVSLAFSQDNKRLVSGSRDQTIRIWDAATGKELQPRDGGSGVHPVFVSPDGKMLASTSWDRKVRLWSLATGRQLHALEGHTSAVYTLAFSPDSRVVASASADNTIRLWETSSGREIRKLEGHTALIYSVVFLPDGKTVASGASDGTLRFWDWSAGKELRRIDSGGHISGLTVSSDGRILGGQAKRPTLWDAETGAVRREWSDNLIGVALLSDGRSCWTENSEGTFQLWNPETGEELRAISGPGHAPGYGWAGVPHLVLSPDGRFLAHVVGPSQSNDIANANYVIKIVEMATGAIRRQFIGHRAPVVGRAFSVDGKTLFTGSEDTTILAWDLTRQNDKRPDRLGAADLAAHWTDLGSGDGERADRSIRTLAARQAESVPYLKTKLRPTAAVDPKLLTRLIADLESGQFAVRQKAHQELDALDTQVGPALRKAQGASPALEMKRRLEAILAKLRGPLAAPDILRSYRAVEVLESIGNADSKGVLHDLAKGAPESRQTQEAQAALRRLERSAGQGR